jgi:hypothetical protein
MEIKEFKDLLLKRKLSDALSKVLKNIGVLIGEKKGDRKILKGALNTLVHLTGQESAQGKTKLPEVCEQISKALNASPNQKVSDKKMKEWKGSLKSKQT